MSAQQIPLEYIRGTINADIGSGKAYVFHCPRNRPDEKETYAGQSSARIGKGVAQTYPARLNIRGEIGGTVCRETTVFPAGEILKIFAKSSALIPQRGRLDIERTAAQYILLDAEAPLHSITLLVPGVISDSAFPWTVKGRFYLLTLEQARARGVQVLPSTAGQCDALNVEALFRCVELSPGKPLQENIQAVIKEDGKRVLTPARPRRLIRLRK